VKVTPFTKRDAHTAKVLEVALNRWLDGQLRGDAKHLKAFKHFMDHASPTVPVGDNPYAGPDGTPKPTPKPKPKPTPKPEPEFSAKRWRVAGDAAIETFPMECPHCARVYWYAPSDAKDVAPPECVAAITKQRDEGGEDRATRWWKTLCASAKKAALDEQKRNAPKSEHKSIEVSARMNNALTLLKVLASHQPGRDGALLEAIRNELVAALDAPERAERGA